MKLLIRTPFLVALLIVPLLATRAASVVANPVAAPQAHSTVAKTLDIYFIDVEGGQSTLIVTPAGQSLLIDAGFAGDGTFASLPGDPKRARDPQRIVAAARDAGVTKIDYLLLTHYHADHAGGVVELAQLMPIGTFIDHAGPPSPEVEVHVPGTGATWERYVATRRAGQHVQPAPGDTLPLTGIEAIVVSTAGQTLRVPLAGAGALNAGCEATTLPAQDSVENPTSTGIRLRYGKFRFLDVGDLSGKPLTALTCPRNLIGEVELYLITHHAGVDAADAAVFNTLNPQVAVFNSGETKGGAAETFATLWQLPRIDGWQLHRTANSGAVNMPNARIANLNDSTHAWIKVSASEDGSFTVTNGRTGFSQRYRR